MSEFEMNEMRQQMNILKKKLEQQEIVNEKLIRQSMRKNMRSINRRNFILTAIAILMVPYSYWVFYKMVGFSMAFWIGTSIFMLICAGANIWNNRNLNSSSLMSGDLLEVRNVRITLSAGDLKSLATKKFAISIACSAAKYIFLCNGTIK